MRPDLKFSSMCFALILQNRPIRAYIRYRCIIGGFSWASNKIVPESSLTVRLDIVKTDCLNTISTENPVHYSQLCRLNRINV